MERVMQESQGVITVVQEHRFQLRMQDGRHRRFELAHDAPLGWEELHVLQRRACAVAVRHDAAPGGTRIDVAHAVMLLD
ncbi:hypothetical protein [Noviherbaspirillum galbum]|uniref:Uncharacterized protein n=1 Tax=Noviherbaspirillum galbum TaxID=2709383 RepID=A0A6B3SKD0_9BURK|nr:hypothetical protein [Noviherbaspirillum galbum]NEX61008.1 hypothetical protein [Noviherbaspirillum galbum]